MHSTISRDESGGAQQISSSFVVNGKELLHNDDDGQNHSSVAPSMVTPLPTTAYDKAALAVDPGVDEVESYPEQESQVLDLSKDCSWTPDLLELPLLVTEYDAWLTGQGYASQACETVIDIWARYERVRQGLKHCNTFRGWDSFDEGGVQELIGDIRDGEEDFRTLYRSPATSESASEMYSKLLNFSRGLSDFVTSDASHFQRSPAYKALSGARQCVEALQAAWNEALAETDHNEQHALESPLWQKTNSIWVELVHHYIGSLNLQLERISGLPEVKKTLTLKGLGSLGEGDIVSFGVNRLDIRSLRGTMKEGQHLGQLLWKSSKGTDWHFSMYKLIPYGVERLPDPHETYSKPELSLFAKSVMRGILKGIMPPPRKQQNTALGSRSVKGTLASSQTKREKSAETLSGTKRARR